MKRWLLAAAMMLPNAVSAQSECDILSGNLVTNCGFESGTLGGWTLAGDIAPLSVSALAAHSGSFGAVFGPTSGTLTNLATLPTLLQTVNTPIAGTYQFSAWINATGGSGTQTQFRVGIGIPSQGDLLFLPSGWRLQTFQFLTFDPTVNIRLVFGNLQAPVYVDDVSLRLITAVPEPSTYALMALGLGGLLLMRRRIRV